MSFKGRLLTFLVVGLGPCVGYLCPRYSQMYEYEPATLHWALFIGAIAAIYELYNITKRKTS